MIKIYDQRLVKIYAIAPGDVFGYKGVLYIKTNSKDFPAVNLETGELASFDGSDEVTVVEHTTLYLE